MSIRPRQIQEKKKNPLLVFAKPGILIVLIILGYFIARNWDTVLENISSKPISSFALIGKDNYTTSEDILSNLRSMGELRGYFAQNVEDVQQNLKQIPWVKNAYVRKIWPDKLYIDVVEYQPVAFWNNDRFLAQDGTIFQLPEDKIKSLHLAHLSGANDQSKEALDAWIKITKILKDKNIHINSLDINERGALKVALTNGIWLNLGRNDFMQKIDHFVTIFPEVQIPEGKEIAYIDLRYKDGAAVGFKDKKMVDEVKNNNG